MSDSPEEGTESELTHTDEEGEVQMVDVGDKPDTARRAVAAGEIHLQATTIEEIGRASCRERV